ncbi:hypothetical protein [Herbaspirillum sp. SJZ107]|uniref:hypothetical protein n=1 Tax=Herbaspirillum sp. SJZ107 TaxID=2572881 RepID=UPI00115214A5|nr:hypothetical protein [Herbaspirillum sp. SJZ107]TQK06813.1 hypothetical protein FBX97_2076 [Herbaspirillum sp. SJZ107]
MKSSILRAGVALACALGLAACGGGDGDLLLQGTIYSGVTADGRLAALTKDGLVLTNNGGDDLAISAGATSFQFKRAVSTDDEFNIEVKAKPSNIDTCIISNGKARANYYTIAQVGITCYVKTHKFAIQIAGLTTNGLVVVNGSDRKDVPANATSLKMDDVYEDGAYGVTVLQQPSGQTCSVENGSGTMGSTDTDNNKVVVRCS